MMEKTIRSRRLKFSGTSGFVRWRQLNICVKLTLITSGIPAFRPFSEVVGQENWHSGRHTILLYYPIENVVPNYTNIFNVYMRCVGGTAAVDTGMCIASISGQSMGAPAAWDGRIDIEEYVDLFRIGNGSQNGRLQVKAFTEADEWEVKLKSGIGWISLDFIRRI